MCNGSSNPEMGLEVHITTGSRAGEREKLTRAVVLAGRHPECDLRFDARKDLDVSSRHAEFRGGPDGWTVRDLESTNGTFVNGSRITHATDLKAGDVVRFGAEGPRVQIVSVGAVDEPAVPATAFHAGDRVRPSTTERVAVAVAKETGALRRFVIGLTIVAVVGVGALVWANQRNSARSRDTIASLLARSDSLSAALQRTMLAESGRQAGLDSFARVLERERERITRQLQSGSANVGQIQTELDALDHRASQAAAIGASYRDIAQANTPGVVFLVVEDQDGQAYSGTGFSITRDGLLVTARHVVINPVTKQLPRRIGLWFAGDTTWYLANFVRAADSVDLAFVKIDAEGEFPTVQGISRGDNVAAGDAIAVLGFPLGTTLARGTVKRPSLNIGSVSQVEPDRIHIEAYSAQGASGAPVFDTRGDVIGVLFGSPVETDGAIIYLVSSAALIRELRPNERSLVR